MSRTPSSGRIAALIARLFATAVLVGIAPGAAATDDASALRQQAHAALKKRDFALALVLFERAAAGGDLLAAERAGEMLLEGQTTEGAGVPEDLARASALLRIAACAGSASAAALLEELRRKLDALACGNT